MTAAVRSSEIYHEGLPSKNKHYDSLKNREFSGKNYKQQVSVILAVFRMK